MNQIDFSPRNKVRLLGALGLLVLLAPAQSLRAQSTTTADTPFVQQVQVGKLRNDFTGYVGLHFTTGASPMVVSSLGRYMVAGNTGIHRLKLVDAATGQEVPGGAASLSMSGGTPGQFKYAALPGPVTLAATTSYYLMSQETAGGDQWYDDNTQVLLNAPTAPPPVVGTGLAASYYNSLDLSGPVALTLTDPTVDFTWPAEPGAGVGADRFSVRWSGQVLAPASGSYTFTTTSDDGVRLWVNGQQLINNWTDHASTDNSATLTLTAGQRYDLRLEYYERGGGAVCRLSWAYPGQSQQVIPQSQLFPAASAQRTAVAAAPSADPALSLSAYPNPSPDGRATLRLIAQQSQRATVQVFDQQGQFISLLTVPLREGQTEFKLPSVLAPGTYYLKTHLDGQAQQFTLKVE